MGSNSQIPWIVAKTRICRVVMRFNLAPAIRPAHAKNKGRSTILGCRLLWVDNGRISHIVI